MLDNKNRLYRFWGKRALDLILTVPILVVLAPVIVVIALLLRAKMGSPVIFRQQRPGLRGKPFVLHKFRTMTNVRDKHGSLLLDAERLTSFGKFLRRLSLDELPTLINVIKGDMSIMGPRPLLREYLQRYTPEQMRRHEVKPGITGWAQVNGRNAITWEEKFSLDVWYVEHVSFWLDIKILLLTLWKTIKGEGINQPGQTTMEKFMGRESKYKVP